MSSRLLLHHNIVLAHDFIKGLISRCGRVGTAVSVCGCGVGGWVIGGGDMDVPPAAKGEASPQFECCGVVALCWET